MHPKQPVVHLQLNPAGPRSVLHRALADGANNVAVGLQSLNEYHPSTWPALPTDLMNFGFSDPTAVPAPEQVELLKDAHREWLLLAGFSGLIRAVTAASIEAWLFCEILRAARDGDLSSESDVRDAESVAREAASRWSLPDLFSRLETRFRSEIAGKEHVLSINRARNCLEHRHGVVGRPDLDRQSSLLTLRWKRIKTYYVKDGEEVDVRAGSIIENATILMRTDECSKQFALGERLVLTVDEFNQSMFTCYLMGVELSEKLASHAAPHQPHL